MRQKILFAAITAGFLLAGPANAAPVLEGEVALTATNNTTATAHAISGASFTLPPPPIVVYDPPGWATASIVGTNGGIDVDFYSFSTTGGGALFDIDTVTLPATFDSMLSLFNSSGTLIAFDDDTAPEPGSLSLRDAFIGTIQLAAGDYFIAVTQFSNFPTGLFTPGRAFAPLTRPDGTNGGDAISFAAFGESSFDNSGNDGGLAYTLHISLEGVAAIPEPEVYALMLSGLGLIGFVARRRRIVVSPN